MPGAACPVAAPWPGRGCTSPKHLTSQGVFGGPGQMLQPGLVPALCATPDYVDGVRGGGWLRLSAYQSPSRAPVSTYPAIQLPVHILRMGWGPADAWAPVNPHPAVQPFVLQQGWGLADARAPVGPHPAAEPVVHVLQQGVTVRLALGCLSVRAQLPTSSWGVAGAWAPISPHPAVLAVVPLFRRDGCSLCCSAFPPPRRSTNCAPVPQW